MINKETESGADIKIEATDMKVEIKKGDSDYKTTETKKEIQTDYSNSRSFVIKQETHFNFYKSQTAESQDIKPIVKYFENEERIQAKIEQHLLTAEIEPDNKITKKGEDISHNDDNDNQDMKPIVKYFEYEEMMQVKMEKDLLPEEREVDGNLSQSTSGESGLVISDVRSLCKEGKLHLI